MNPRPHLSIARIAAALASCCLAVDAVHADEPPEQVVIRGVTETVWPASDLRQKGFEVPDIPREENAAWTYLEAINTFTDLPDALDDAFEYAYKTTWPSGSAGKKLETWIAHEDNRRALDLAHQASQMERCQILYFGDPGQSVIALLLPSLTHYRQLAKMLVVDGRRLEAHRRYAEAFESYATAWRMGGHLAGGVTLIEALVGVACSAVGDTAIREMVLRHELPPALLDEILDRTEQLAQTRPNTQRGVRMEKHFGLNMVDELVSRPLAAPRNMSGLWEGIGVHPADVQGWGALEARLGRLILPDQTIKQHLSSFYDEQIRRAELPAHEADWGGDWEERLIRSIPRWDVLARTLLPSLSRANLLAERLRAATQMTRLCAALRLHAARHDGSFPERLDELSGVLGDSETLIDPFSGEQFVYLPSKAGWVLYSIGGNGVDDGGEEGDRPWKLDFVCRFPAPEVEPFEQ